MTASVAVLVAALVAASGHAFTPTPLRAVAPHSRPQGCRRGDRPRWTIGMAVDRGSRAPPPPRGPTLPMNDMITADPLRVVVAAPGGEQDEMLGVISRAEAMAKAEGMGMDLVMISEKSDPPVCKIVDYGKLKYQMERKKKDTMKKAKGNELKEVKMSYKIDTHDYEVRQRAAAKFLKGGSRVKAVIQFKGREQQYISLGEKLLEKLAGDCAGLATADKSKREGNRLIMFLNPVQTQKMQAGASGPKTGGKNKKKKGGEAEVEVAATAGEGEAPEATEGTEEVAAADGGTDDATDDTTEVKAEAAEA